MERADSAEFSVRWRGGRVHADGSLWATSFNDYIYGALTGNFCDEEGACAPDNGADLKEMFYTQRDAKFRGAEGHAQIELLRQGSGDLHLELMADTVRATLDDGGGNVPRIPPYRVGAGLQWQGPRLDAGVNVRYSGRQDKDRGWRDRNRRASPRSMRSWPGGRGLRGRASSSRWWVATSPTACSAMPWR